MSSQQQNHGAGMAGAATLGRGLLRWLGLALLTGTAGWVLYRLLPPRWVAGMGWPEAAFLVSLCGVVIMAQCRNVPCQNVLFAGALVAGLAGGVELGAGWLGFPLLDPGPTDAGKLFGVLSWPVPLLWVSGILLARGTSRVLLECAGGSRNYGLRVLGSTMLFFLIFQVGLDAFAAAKTGSGSTGPGSSMVWFRFLAGSVLAFLILLAITPVLLEKKPVKSPVSRVPLFAWLVVHGLFLSGAVVSRAWVHVGLIALMLATVSVAGWRTRRVRTSLVRP